ncbi:hypothetical protein PINS_up002294 [Pythium insidiosum]|nr:hypothetical protein PINS_up002294 [Pythium insidiosum]
MDAIEIAPTQRRSSIAFSSESDFSSTPGRSQEHAFTSSRDGRHRAHTHTAPQFGTASAHIGNTITNGQDHLSPPSPSPDTETSETKTSRARDDALPPPLLIVHNDGPTTSAESQVPRRRHSVAANRNVTSTLDKEDDDNSVKLAQEQDDALSSLNATYNQRDRTLSKTTVKSKRIRLARSASFDVSALRSSGVLGSGVLSSSGQRSPSAASVAASDCGSEKATKKCFDDSDIVDDHSRSGRGDESPVFASVDASGTLLRFPVYDVGSKAHTPGSRLSLARFGRRNIVLDRYTLEVDCAQEIVRVKSIFMHRMWSFRCEAVRDIVFTSDSSSTARVEVTKYGGHGVQMLEWQFGSDEEREEFKMAVEMIHSRHLLKGVPSSRSPSARSMGRQDPQASAGASKNESLDRHPKQFEEDSHHHNHHHTRPPLVLLCGETRMADYVDLPATLLVGSAGDSLETSVVWGRIRGLISVTNYRVLFQALERGQVPYRSTTFGSVSYVPLFAITTAQVMYPGGRKGRSVRNASGTLPPVLSISCKDSRTMRVELDGTPGSSEEKTRRITALINSLVESSQRYKKVAADSPTDVPALSLDVAPASWRDMRHSRAIHSGGSEVSSPRSPLALGDIDGISPYLGPSTPPTQAPGTIERSDVFAFSFSSELTPAECNGWNVYTDEREFKRQISGDPVAQPFLKFYQNGRGTMCSSYPAKLLVPSSMTKSTLAKVAEFRAKNRLPVITFYHQRNRCVLVRSGQPLLGNLLSGTSSLSDQLLVGVYRRLPEIIRTQSSAAPSSRPIYIFDARKLKASTGNRLMGKGGVETPQDYPGAVVHHLDIANMYRMQSSFLALLKLVAPGGVDDQDKTWLASLEATRWLHHVRVVLDGAVKIARVLELEGSSALVHCSDGWDRTSQLTALAQLMIDPFYRTIRGFAVLVEKDWCAFGHKFAERLGGDRNKDPNRHKSSPVMLQFLDCVWQILRQFPNAFEFNERFLLHLANSLTSGLYGTFLYDSRLQREINGVDQHTVSVWTPVLMSPTAYQNQQYVAQDKPIWPWTNPQMIKLWETYFFQWHPKYHDCRWISSLVHHSGHAESAPNDPIDFQPAAQPSSHGHERSESRTTSDASGPESASARRDRDKQAAESMAKVTADHRNLSTSAPSPASSNSIRSTRQQTKPPPMHKIFLFKS